MFPFTRLERVKEKWREEKESITDQLSYAPFWRGISWFERSYRSVIVSFVRTFFFRLRSTPADYSKSLVASLSSLLVLESTPRKIKLPRNQRQSFSSQSTCSREWRDRGERQHFDLSRLSHPQNVNTQPPKPQRVFSRQRSPDLAEYGQV